MQVDTASDISTVAGNPTSAYSSGYSGDGRSATAAYLNGPSRVAMSEWGDLFISDTNNNAIRQVGHFKHRISTNIMSHDM